MKYLLMYGQRIKQQVAYYVLTAKFIDDDFSPYIEIELLNWVNYLGWEHIYICLTWCRILDE